MGHINITADVVFTFSILTTIHSTQMSIAELISKKSFKDLIAWQKSVRLVKSVYRVASQFPKYEQYALWDQMRRAAVSVPSNIAEGQSHKGIRDFVRYVRLARGSLAELETQLLIAHDLGYVDVPVARALLSEIEEVSRITSGLIRSLEQS